MTFSEVQIQSYSNSFLIKWLLSHSIQDTQHKQYRFSKYDCSSYLCKVFAGLALVLVAAGMEVARDGRDPQVQLAILDKDVF